MRHLNLFCISQLKNTLYNYNVFTAHLRECLCFEYDLDLECDRDLGCEWLRRPDDLLRDRTALFCRDLRVEDRDLDLDLTGDCAAGLVGLAALTVALEFDAFLQTFSWDVHWFVDNEKHLNA